MPKKIYIPEYQLVAFLEHVKGTTLSEILTEILVVCFQTSTCKTNCSPKYLVEIKVILICFN